MAAFGYTYSHFTAANPAVTNQFVVSVNMKVGAYTVANSGAFPGQGARHVSVTHTTVAGTDTLGTITFVGTDLSGQTITEVITPVADSLATGVLWFASVTSITGAGWVAVSTADTIVAGCSAGAVVAVGGPTLGRVVVNTTAAGAITLADSRGTLGILKSSIAEGSYTFEVICSGFLSVTLAAASDVTIIHTASLPQTYSM